MKWFRNRSPGAGAGFLDVVRQRWQASPRLRRIGHGFGELAGVALLYLVCQILVWALSHAFRPTSVHFPASVIGMILVFGLMCALQRAWRATNRVYGVWIKSKVDFINNNIGVAFPVPMIMVSKGRTLDAVGVGRVIAAFVSTAAVFWVFIFLLCSATLLAVLQLRFRVPQRPDLGHLWLGRWIQEDANWSLFGNFPRNAPPPSRWISSSTTIDQSPSPGTESLAVSNCTTLMGSPEPSEVLTSTGKHTSPTKIEEQVLEGSSLPPVLAAWATFVEDHYPVLLSLSCVAIVGIPVAICTGDARIMDGCFLWFLWISLVRIQRNFKHSSSLASYPRTRDMLATLLNPVMWTTLAMTAYIRARAALSPNSLFYILAQFSSGTPLSDLWTFRVANIPLPPSEEDWFGAGDAALSILESGIVAWGFKLFECRKELWSRVGATVVLLSFASAAASVFISVLLGRAVGLAEPESLAFAARSTTLALARPAMAALGANEMVNAAVIVCNGILGQLAYPYVLSRLQIPGQSDCESRRDCSANTPDREAHDAGSGTASNFDPACVCEGGMRGRDDALTVAAGTTIGINGAAMGVSYLYEQGSRAAPYAALAMTIFGVMNVVFTSVEPFSQAVRRVAVP